MNTMEAIKLSTWLPVFSGFYGTYWDSNDKIDQEIEHINELREEKGLEPIDSDACEFDYKEYELQVVKGIAAHLEKEFKQFVSGIEIEKIVSPREYNFYNDSANVSVELSDDNVKAIEKYLSDNSEQFTKYLERYKSCSGFISHYPHTIEEFIGANLMEALEHVHKLGSILDFIFKNEDSEIELNTYYNVESYLQVTNYDELVPE